jgi:hypothetical protein
MATMHSFAVSGPYWRSCQAVPRRGKDPKPTASCQPAPPCRSTFRSAWPALLPTPFRGGGLALLPKGNAEARPSKLAGPPSITMGA